MPHAEQGSDEPDDAPSLLQELHSATGDRDREAKALADRSDAQVSEEDARRAVGIAHGDLGDEPSPTERDVATTTDAEALREDRMPPASPKPD